MMGKGVCSFSHPQVDSLSTSGWLTNFVRNAAAAFLLELTGAREIVLVKIGTDYNAADLFTKVLAVEKFDTFTAYVLGETG